jgi:hypothetical protein
MESTYYDLSAPASYGGLSKFKPKGYTKKEITEWLQTQDPYTLHKPISDQSNLVEHLLLVRPLRMFPIFVGWNISFCAAHRWLSPSRCYLSKRQQSPTPIRPYSPKTPSRRRKEVQNWVHFFKTEVETTKGSFVNMESTYADLVDVSRISSYNKGFKYLLTCIDVLSRY